MIEKNNKKTVKLNHNGFIKLNKTTNPKRKLVKSSS